MVGLGDHLPDPETGADLDVGHVRDDLAAGPLAGPEASAEALVAQPLDERRDPPRRRLEHLVRRIRSQQTQDPISIGVHASSYDRFAGSGSEKRTPFATDVFRDEEE